MAIIYFELIIYSFMFTITHWEGVSRYLPPAGDIVYLS